jgi:RNA polymerase sigma-70 factor (ECF subfamily)
MAAMRTGSPDAAGLLCQTYRNYLLLVANERLGPDLRVKVPASDLVQETFLAAHQSILEFQGSTPMEFGAWLRGILINKLAHAQREYLVAACRDLKREVPLGGKEGVAEQHAAANGASASALAVRSEDRDRVRLALSRLPAHYRQVIELRNFELLPFEAIAERMQSTSGPTRALWGRAIKKLTRELDGYQA